MSLLETSTEGVIWFKGWFEICKRELEGFKGRGKWGKRFKLKSRFELEGGGSMDKKDRGGEGRERWKKEAGWWMGRLRRAELGND